MLPDWALQCRRYLYPVRALRYANVAQPAPAQNQRVTRRFADAHFLFVDCAVGSWTFQITGFDAKLGNGRPLLDLDDFAFQSKVGQGTFDDTGFVANFGELRCCVVPCLSSDRAATPHCVPAQRYSVPAASRQHAPTHAIRAQWHHWQNQIGINVNRICPGTQPTRCVDQHANDVGPCDVNTSKTPQATK